VFDGDESVGRPLLEVTAWLMSVPHISLTLSVTTDPSPIAASLLVLVRPDGLRVMSSPRHVLAAEGHCLLVSSRATNMRR
jgi:hypothetical protein